MARLIFFLLPVTLAYGCALTVPEGTKVLLDDISRDKAGQRNQADNFVGKPVFLKVRAYPRVEGANIYGKHWILMKTGNEKIDLDPLLNEINNER